MRYVSAWLVAGGESIFWEDSAHAGKMGVQSVETPKAMTRDKRGENVRGIRM